MTNKVTITVSGGAGTGKTTIADLLYEFLVEQGFNTGQIAFEELCGREENKERRLQSVKDNAVIIVKEKSTLRSEL